MYSENMGIYLSLVGYFQLCSAPFCLGPVKLDQNEREQWSVHSLNEYLCILQQAHVKGRQLRLDFFA